MTVLAVTGADGFVGTVLCRTLEENGFSVARIVRRAEGPGADRRVADLSVECDLDELLQGVDTVIHLAGRAHVLKETESDPRAAFRRANVEATTRLADAAIRASVRRLVFVSSVHVNGTQTHGRPFTETDRPAPREPYGESKLEAEESLKTLCSRSKLEYVIVRPPLVYGAGVKGNFERLIRLAARGTPLPIGSVRNRRSIIGVENLADFLLRCATHPAAVGETFLIAEPDPHSTPELVSSLARALGRPSRVFNVPVGVLRLCATALGRRSEFEKLCGSLEVCSVKAQRVLGWTPRSTFEEEIARAVAPHLRGAES